MPNELANAVMALKTPKNTWRDIGNLLGVNHSLAWQVAHGKCDSPKIRHVLRMPPKMIAVAPCGVCGEVHVKKTCTKKKGRKRLRQIGEYESDKNMNAIRRMTRNNGISYSEWLNLVAELYIILEKGDNENKYVTGSSVLD